MLTPKVSLPLPAFRTWSCAGDQAGIAGVLGHEDHGARKLQNRIVVERGKRQVGHAGLGKAPGVGPVGGHHHARQNIFRQPDAELNAQIGGIVDKQRGRLRRRSGGAGHGVVEGAVNFGAVGREDAAADVGLDAERIGDGPGRVGVVGLRDDAQRRRVVQRETGHEARAVGRHRKHRGLSGHAAGVNDGAGGDFVDEQISGGGGGSGEADDELPVRAW